MIEKERSSQKETLNLIQNLGPIDFLFRPKSYSKIIGPGSQKPFDFDMLLDVEDMFKFDIHQNSAEKLKGLHNKVDQKLQLTFWNLLRTSAKVWLYEEINFLLSCLFNIGTGVLTKFFLDELNKDDFSHSSLGFLVFSIILVGLCQTFVHMNYLLLNNLLMRLNENRVKVKQKHPIKNLRDRQFFEWN